MQFDGRSRVNSGAEQSSEPRKVVPPSHPPILHRFYRDNGKFCLKPQISTARKASRSRSDGFVARFAQQNQRRAWRRALSSFQSQSYSAGCGRHNPSMCRFARWYLARHSSPARGTGLVYSLPQLPASKTSEEVISALNDTVAALDNKPAQSEASPTAVAFSPDDLWTTFASQKKHGNNVSTAAMPQANEDCSEAAIAPKKASELDVSQEISCPAGSGRSSPAAACESKYPQSRPQSTAAVLNHPVPPMKHKAAIENLRSQAKNGQQQAISTLPPRHPTCLRPGKQGAQQPANAVSSKKGMAVADNNLTKNQLLNSIEAVPTALQVATPKKRSHSGTKNLSKALPPLPLEATAAVATKPPAPTITSTRARSSPQVQVNKAKDGAANLLMSSTRLRARFQSTEAAEAVGLNELESRIAQNRLSTNTAEVVREFSALADRAFFEPSAPCPKTLPAKTTAAATRQQAAMLGSSSARTRTRYDKCPSAPTYGRAGEGSKAAAAAAVNSARPTKSLQEQTIRRQKGRAMLFSGGIDLNALAASSRG